MFLASPEASEFSILLNTMLFFVHQEKRLEPGCDTLEEFWNLPATVKCATQEAFSREPDLVDTFLDAYAHDFAGRVRPLPPEAPGLSSDQCETMRSWRHLVAGKFTMAKSLKAGAILVGGSKNVPYLVLGVKGPLEDMLYGMPLPALVETLLVPFRGRIVCSGLLKVYRVHYGPGIRKTVEAEYQAARRNGRVVTCLVPGSQVTALPPSTPARPARDWSADTAEVLRRAEAIRGGATPFESPAYALLRAAASLADLAAKGATDPYDFRVPLSKVHRALTRLQNVASDQFHGS